MPRINIRRDLFHAFDLLACKVSEGILGLQVTSASNVAARLAKLRAQPDVATWLETGGRAQVWGWKKVNGHWHARIIELLPGDVNATMQKPPRTRRQPRMQPGDLFASVD